MHRKNLLLLITLLFIINGFSQNTQAQKDSINKAWKLTLEKENRLHTKSYQDTIIQNIWWADKLIEFSSEFSDNNKSAKQILGKPNVMPIGGASKMAWAVKEKKGIEQKGEGKIIVGYSSPKRIRQIIIAESYNPGSIKYVIMYGENDEKEIAYARTPKDIKKTSRILNIFLDDLSTFKVKKIELQTYPNAVQGRNEIDAVGISDSKDTILIRINRLPKLVFQSKPESLGKTINTKYDEIAPIISSDGKLLYFDRRFYPLNMGKQDDSDDIWYSKKLENNTWSEAQDIEMPLNNNWPNYIQAVMPDGNSVLLANEYLRSGDLAPGVSISHKTKGGWSFPNAQRIKKFYNQSQHANYFLTNDGRFLLMAIQQKDSQGDLDLYVSKRIKDNEWTQPLNLGSNINTIGNDYSPFLAADGVSLYFSSEGYSGYGKADIYVSKRIDDSWQKWSEPENLGPVINSAGMDSKYNIPANSEYAYFSSTHNSIGGNDIFRIKLPKEIKPAPVVMVSGFVLDKKDSSALDARIIVEKLPEGEEIAIARSNPKDGSFSFILQPNQQYGFRGIALNHFEDNKNLSIDSINQYLEIKNQDLYLSPIEIGQIIRLNNIFFETAKSILKKESFPELNRVVSFLENNKNIEIQVSGHTDNVGTEQYNLNLSKKRAASVAEYLTSNGINKTRVVSKGYGESQPETSNETEEGKQINRRVEFKILKK